MLKYAAAVAALLLGLAAASAPAIAGPPDSDNAPRIRQEMDRSRASADAPEQGEPSSYPERTSETPSQPCGDCAPRKHYDQVEVVKSSRDVDRSRVINTESVVQVPPRVKEYNKLVIHENQTRNVGVIQHNHRIIEKEIRYVKRVPVYRTRYKVIERVQPVIVPQPQPCGCCSCGGGLIGALTGHHGGAGYAPSYGYNYGYGYAAPPIATQRVLVPMDVPVTYGYR